MVDEKKNPLNLKNAIFMRSGLDAIDPKVLKEMKSKEQRYNRRSEGLMVDPFYFEKPKKKKKWLIVSNCYIWIFKIYVTKNMLINIINNNLLL